MASQEHLQQLADDSSTNSSASSSSDSSSDNTSVSEEDQPQPMELSSQPPKMRIKLSLKMPAKQQDNDEAPREDDTNLPVAEATSPKEADGDVVMQDAPVADADVTSKSSQKSPSRRDEDNDEDDGDDDKTDEEEDDNKNENDDDDEPIVEATIVQGSDGEGHVEVKTEKVQEATEVVQSQNSGPSNKTKATSAGNATKSDAKRSATVQSSIRPAKLPAMSSPGLLIPASTAAYRGDADANGFVTPASVFDYAMSTAGYTTERRTEHPHRGSSVKRIVDDMFDSNVLFTLHFPPLVPKKLRCRPKPKETEPDESSGKQQKQDRQVEGERDLAQLLIGALSPPNAISELADGAAESATTSRKRRPLSFSDMVPVSLTLPYPESFLENRVRYVQQVEARERAIVASQEAALAAEEAKEKYEEDVAIKDSSGKQDAPVPPPSSAPIQVPSIPEPPSPPRLADMDDSANLDKSILDDSNHPFYRPKQFVSHLDKSCFHITDGRYFGLTTNSIADPQFIGPNAPGLTLSTGTGLATSYAGASAVGSGALTSTVYQNNLGSSTNSGTGGGGAGSSDDPVAAAKSNSGTTKKSESTSQKKSMPKPLPLSRSSGPTPTATAADLRKLMERDDAEAAAMKECIMRAAVYASRTGKHGSFVGNNGETYPSVSKAFSAYCGIRPCNRCKNNKQGAYHCRLRRKHQDLDYDGGNSPGILAPLFAEPLEDLLVK